MEYLLVQREDMQLQHSGPPVTVHTPLLYKDTDQRVSFFRRVPWAIILLSFAVIVASPSEQVLRTAFREALGQSPKSKFFYEIAHSCTICFVQRRKKFLFALCANSPGFCPDRMSCGIFSCVQENGFR